jgi:hypothetical protein
MKPTIRPRLACGQIWYDLFVSVSPNAAATLISHTTWNGTFVGRKISRDHFYNILPCIESELESVS